MTFFKFYRGNKDKIPKTLENGALYLCYEEDNSLYIAMDLPDKDGNLIRVNLSQDKETIAQIEKINEALATLEQAVAAQGLEIETLQTKDTELQIEIESLKTKDTELQTEIESLKTKDEEQQTEIETIKENVSNLTNDKSAVTFDNQILLTYIAPTIEEEY